MAVARAKSNRAAAVMIFRVAFSIVEKYIIGRVGFACFILCFVRSCAVSICLVLRYHARFLPAYFEVFFNIILN